MRVDWKAVAEHESAFKIAVSHNDFAAAEAEANEIYKATNLRVDKSYLYYAQLLNLILAESSVEACYDLCEKAVSEKAIQAGYIDGDQEANNVHRWTYPPLKYNFFKGIVLPTATFTSEDLNAFVVLNVKHDLLVSVFDHYISTKAVRDSKDKMELIARFVAALEPCTCENCKKDFEPGVYHCAGCGKLRPDLDKRTQEIVELYRSRFSRLRYFVFAVGVAVLGFTAVLCNIFYTGG